MKSVLYGVVVGVLCLGLLIARQASAFGPVTVNWAVTANTTVGKIVAVSPTSMNCTQNGNCATGTTLTSLTAICYSNCPASATYSLATTATPGCTTGQVANSGDFNISGASFRVNSSGPDISGGHLNQGTYSAGVVVTMSNSPNSGVCIPVTVTSVNGPTMTLNGWGNVSNVYVVGGSSMSVTVSGGTGTAPDQVYICDTTDGCNTFTYLNCSTSQPGSPYPTGMANCPIIAPSNFSSTLQLVYQQGGGSRLVIVPFQTVTQVPTMAAVTLSNSTFTCGTPQNVGVISLLGSGNVAGANLALTDTASQNAGLMIDSNSLPANLHVGPAACSSTPNGNSIIGIDNVWVSNTPGAWNGNFLTALGRYPMLYGNGNFDVNAYPAHFGLYPCATNTAACFNANAAATPNTWPNAQTANWDAWNFNRIDPYGTQTHTYFARICSEWMGDSACCPWGNAGFGNCDQGSAANEVVSPAVWKQGMCNFIAYTRARAGWQNVKIAFDTAYDDTPEERKFYDLYNTCTIDLVTYDAYPGLGQGGTSAIAWQWLLAHPLALMLGSGLPMAFPEYCDKFPDGYITAQQALWNAAHNVVAMIWWEDGPGGPGAVGETTCQIDSTPQKAQVFAQYFRGYKYTGTFWPQIYPWPGAQ